METELLVTNRILDLVAEGIDLAIRAGALKDSRLIAKRFVLGQFALWASPSYLKKRGVPSHPKELSQHECLRFSRFKAKAWELTNDKETTAVMTTGRVLADDFETLKAIALQGEGVGFVPSFLCAKEAQEKKLTRVLPDWHGDAVSFSMVYPAQRFVSPKVRAFITVAEATLKEPKILKAL